MSTPKIAIYCGIALAVLMLVSSPGAATADHDKGHFVVKIDDDGFNGTGEFTIEVEQGQLVELTFVWAHRAHTQEEHIIVLEGYKLETGKINALHREDAIKFIAEKPGTFTFKCDLDCDLHERLQKGHLKVKAGGSAGGAARTPTNLALTPSSWRTQGEIVSLMTVLKDNKGAPVSKAEVRYFVDAEFVNVKDKMEVGTTKTDANGVAFLDYRPTFTTPKQKITAVFEGMGIYAESQQAIELEETAPLPPAYIPASAGLDDIRRYAPFALAAVVLGVWTTYGFVLFQVFGIFRSRTRR